MDLLRHAADRGLPNGEQSLELRLVRREDEEFLSLLFESVRAPELKVLGWEQAQIRSFCSMQKQFRDLAFKNHAPAPTTLLITLDGSPVGRLDVAQDFSEWRVMTIELFTEFRGRGIGTEVLRWLAEAARAAGASIALQVRNDNPAQRLYLRMGFSVNAQDDLHLHMTWNASVCREVAA
jgi:ribosomal protein S18 acetylase RimI-like enzyme